MKRYIARYFRCSIQIEEKTSRGELSCLFENKRIKLIGSASPLTPNALCAGMGTGDVTIERSIEGTTVIRVTFRRCALRRSASVSARMLRGIARTAAPRPKLQIFQIRYRQSIKTLKVQRFRHLHQKDTSSTSIGIARAWRCGCRKQLVCLWIRS